MTDRRILAFTGRPAAGKSTAAAYVADMEGVPIVSMGEEVREQRDRNVTAGPNAILGDDKRGYTTWELAEAYRDEHGPRGVAMACTSRIATAFLEHDLVVVDGIRTVNEIEYFSQRFGCPVTVVQVSADDDTRVDRFFSRNKPHTFRDGISEDALRVAAEYELDKRTQRETQAGLDEALDHADFELVNEGDEDDLKAQCARLITDIYGEEA